MTHQAKSNVLSIDIVDAGLAEGFEHVVQDHCHTWTIRMCKEASQSRIISLIELTIVEERFAEDCDVQNLINLTELELYFFRFVTEHQTLDI